MDSVDLLLIRISVVVTVEEGRDPEEVGREREGFRAIESFEVRSPVTPDCSHNNEFDALIGIIDN